MQGIPPGVLNVVHGSEEVATRCVITRTSKPSHLSFDQSGHARLPPRDPGRQTCPVHAGCQESRGGTSGCQQGADTQQSHRSGLRCGWPTLHGSLHSRAGGGRESVDSRSGAQSKALRVNAGTEGGTDIGRSSLLPLENGLTGSSKAVRVRGDAGVGWPRDRGAGLRARQLCRSNNLLGVRPGMQIYEQEIFGRSSSCYPPTLWNRPSNW